MATITKRKDSWFVQIRRKGFTPRYASFDSKLEAQIWARNIEAKIDVRQAPTAAIDSLQLSVSSLIDRYICEITPSKRSSHSEALRLSKMQRHSLCNLPVKSLTPAAIAAYRDDRLRHVTVGTVRRELSLLHHVITVANKEWGIRIGGNPVADVQLPKLNNRRDRRLNDGEFERLSAAMEASKNSFVASIINLAIETAMRRGEILCLEWRFVDLANRTAYIPQTKTGSPRTIPLNDRARSILIGLPRCGERVFPVSMEAFKSAWRRLVIAAGLKDLRFHDLRHEAISRYCEMGLSMPEVALISGHRDPRMLFRYMHMRPTELARKLQGRSWEREQLCRERSE